MDCRDAILSNDYIDFVWKMDVRPPEAEWMQYRTQVTGWEIEEYLYKI